MSINSQVISGVNAAMAAIGDLKIAVTYRRVVPGAYDPATDTTADTVTTYTFEVPRVGLSEEEMPWIPVDKKGAKLLIPRSNLPVMPLITDYVEIEGERWEVIRIRRVPGDSVWIVIIQGA